jgi:hypothetical protein
MGFTYQAQGTNSTYGAVTTISPASTLNANAGDLVVVASGSLNNTITLTGVADSASNSYTLRTAISPDANTYLRLAYAVLTTGSGTLAITSTFADGTTRRNILVAVFRPDAGDVVTLDATGNISTYEDAAWTTSEFTTTEADEAIIAFWTMNTAHAPYTNYEIPSAVAAIALTPGNDTLIGCYRLPAGVLTGAEAEVDAAAGWVAAEVLAFKSVSGGTPITITADGPQIERTEQITPTIVAVQDYFIPHIHKKIRFGL